MSSFTPPPLPPSVPPSMRGEAAPPARMRWLWFAGVAGGAVLLALAGYTGVRLYRANKLPDREKVSLSDKHQQTRAAFSATTPADDQETRDVSAALDRLNAALQQRNATLMQGAFDSGRMCDELDRLGGFATLNLVQKRQAITAMETAIPRMMISQTGFGWSGHKVKKVVLTGDRREAVVYDLETHIRGAGNYSTKVRWWLRKDGNQWKAWDMEALEEGIRLTTIMSSSMNAAASSTAAGSSVLQAAPQIQAVGSALQQGDFNKAEAALKKLDALNLPRDIASIREFCWAAVNLRRGRYPETLKNCDVIELSGQDLPGIHEFRTYAHSHLGQYEDALKSAARWEEALGGDREVYYEQGNALAHLNKPTEAAAAFRKSLDEDPDAFGSLAELSQVLPAGHKSELAARFLRSSNHPKTFFNAVTKLQRKRDLEGMQTLIDAYRDEAKALDDPWLRYYEAELKVIGKKYKEAEAMLKPLLPYATTKDRHVIVQEYIDVARLAGDALQGYANALDAKEAFRKLAAPLMNASDFTTLRQLLALHMKRFAEDPWASYYQAKILSADAKPDEADNAYATAMSLADPKDVATIRYARVSARFNSGGGLLAYQQIPPKEQVFTELARLYNSRKDGDGLAKLVAARKADAPDDAAIPVWDAAAHFLANDYAATISLLEAARPAESERASAYMWSNLYIHANIRLKRFDAAREEANRPVGSRKNWWHIALVECAAGNVPEATHAMQTLLLDDDETDVSQFYSDPDMGPALAQPAFAEWRKTHPNPATQPATQPTTRPIILNQE